MGQETEFPHNNKPASGNYQLVDQNLVVMPKVEGEEEYVQVKRSDIDLAMNQIKQLVEESNNQRADILLAIEFINKLKGIFTDKKGKFDATNVMKLVSSAMIPGGPERLAKEYDLDKLAPLIERYSHLIDTNKAS